MFEDIKNQAFVDELQKIAFGMDGNTNTGVTQPKKSLGQNIMTVAKHPLSFAGHVIGGEVAGAGVGALGGAAVAAPFVAAHMIKHPGEFVEKSERLFVKARKNSTKHLINQAYSQMKVPFQSEATGGAILGGLTGGRKFFQKHQND